MYANDRLYGIVFVSQIHVIGYFIKYLISLAPQVFDCALPHLCLIHRRERGENRASAFVFVSSFSQWPSTERADGDYRLVIPLSDRVNQ